MTHQDKCSAALALMQWFASQGIDDIDSCDVMSIVLAGVIHSAAPNNRRRQRAGANVLRDQVLELIAQGEEVRP